MSPSVPAQASRVERFPRVSGDEPLLVRQAWERHNVFPA